MSTTPDVLENPAILSEVAHSALTHPDVALPQSSPVWDPGAFAREQMRGLVRQIFSSGGRARVRQVVFSAIDAGEEVERICFGVAQELAGQVAGRVCLLKADLHSEINRTEGTQIGDGVGWHAQHAWRTAGRNLWSVSMQDLLTERGSTFSRAWLHGLLTELRCEFQYAVIQCESAGLYNETALLGQLCDGMVLVLRAHKTRRMAAQKVKHVLQAANVRLLGTVLDQRTFPIPDRIYRRL